MSALDQVPPTRLAELLVSAAMRLNEPSPGLVHLAPMGMPVRRGRLHLGRLRALLETSGPLVVAAGFATACWIGSTETSGPNLGRLGYRGETSVDSRGRLLLDLRVRAWLGVEDPMCFDVIAVTAVTGGLLIVPVEEFARRWEVISTCT
jgi:hypothetical protein